MSSKRLTYYGEAVEITFDPKACIHQGECVRGNDRVFNPVRKPWINANGASADEVTAIVARCPSGALQVRRADGGPAAPPPTENVITVSPYGPLFVSGNLRMSLADGSEIKDATRMALCRCGASSNKPFCDNSHVGAEFGDSGAVDADCRQDAASGEGELKLRCAPNGPIMAAGPMRLRAGSGRDAMVDQRAFLCRCGASKNKPFCDGTHSEIGFLAE